MRGGGMCGDRICGGDDDSVTLLDNSMVSMFG